MISKKKMRNRIKRLLTALVIVILLNIFLLLLPAALKPKNTPHVPELFERDIPREEDFAASAKNAPGVAQEITGNDSFSIAENGNLSQAAPPWNNSQGTAENDSGEFINSGNHAFLLDGDDSMDTNDIDGMDGITDANGTDGMDGITDANDIDGTDGITDANGTDGTDGDTDAADHGVDTVTLCLMGDLMCLAGQQYTAERRDGTHDYTGSFYLLRDTFAACDFVVGNLETTLSESNPYSTKEREVNEQPNCNAPADYLASLKWAGITHLVTANNHSLDGGLIGIEETIAHLDEYGIPHTGTYLADYGGAHYIMLEKNGIRIAVLAFTELINQRALVTPSQLSRIIDSYSRADTKQRIAQARSDGADFVVVYEHWGSENVHEVRAYQKDHAKDIAQAGADLIIGSHPHCLQEAETIVTEDGRSVPCFYSLGNVVSSMTRDINHDTVFVQVTLRRQENGEVSADMDTADTKPGSVGIVSITLLPCHVLTALDGHYRVITPVDYKTEDTKAAAELAAANTRIIEIFKSLSQ